LVFGPLGTLQNVAVISWMHITPVVGLRLLVLVCCWPVVGVPVVTPVVMPVVTPSALAALMFASWLFAVAFVGDVCACTLGAASTKTSAAIKANFFTGPTRLLSRTGRHALARLVNVPGLRFVRSRLSQCARWPLFFKEPRAKHSKPAPCAGQSERCRALDMIMFPSTIWKMIRFN